jgi:hypothetical protein
MQEALLLLACRNPHDSPSAYLFEQARRAEVATIVHTALMQAQGQEGRSKLERVLRHLHAVHNQMTAEGIVDAQLISVDDAFRHGLQVALAPSVMDCATTSKPA